MPLRRLAVSRAARSAASSPAIFAVLLFFIGALFPSAMLRAQTLTFTGQVYSPLGPAVTGSTAAHGDPIPNILVFVQDPASPLPVFSQGVTVPAAGQNGCAVQPNLVPATVLGSALTDYSGTYTFNVSGTVSYPINVVIQAGKWRRQYQFTQAQVASYTSGTVVTLPILSMPSNQSQGDLPHIAVVTGSADQIECIFPQIGVSASEVTDPTGTGSINFFSGNASSGEIVSSSTPTETQLVNPAANGAIPISNYDMVIFGCQTWNAGIVDSDVAPYAKNVEAFANEGGRVFGTHGAATWITTPSDWSGIATFDYSGSDSEAASITGQLSTAYTGEPTLAAWMGYIGALNAPVANLQFTLTDVFYNITAVNAPGQTWVTIPSHSSTPAQFSFDTPVNQTGSPSAVVNFTNTQTNFDLGQTGDSIVINVTDNSATATLSGLTLTLQIPSGITPTSLVDSTGGSWVCTLTTPTAICTLPAPLAAGASDAVTLTFDIPATTTPGSVTLTGTLSNGGINQSNQCGRVLYNDYHVETAGSRVAWNNGGRCTVGTTLTNAQKFLEYSLYNLSNFVAPTTSDTIVIQAPSTTTITTNGQPGVTTPIYYGQIIGDTNNVNAIVSTTAPGGTNNGTLTVSVDGTTACTLQNSLTQGTCPNAGFTGQNAGSHTVQASYSGDSEYQPSQSPVYNMTILPDPTATVVTTSGTPSIYGNAVTFTATVTNTAPFTDVALPAPAGTVNFFDGAAQIGTGTLNSSGVAILSVTSLGVGSHTINAVYVPTVNFTASTSVGIAQVVTLPVSATSTRLTSTANPAYQGQNIVLTATVTQLAFSVAVPSGLTNPLPTGTVSFYDGTTLLGTAPLTAALTATVSTSTLAVGTHAITAVYSGDAANTGSTSPVLNEVVQPNTFTLTVNPTTLNLIIGQTAAITVTITDNGDFNEPVQLSCAGQSAETICSFATATIPAGGGTTTLTVMPEPPHNCSTTASNEHPGSKLPIMAGLGVMLLAFRRRRKLLGLVTFGLLLAALPMLSGCNTTGCTDFGVEPGTYTFTVTATSAAPYAQTSNQTMTMVVKP
ncbi:Ig-like domain (group 3) [Bryocella elongata]|uniref:Ig-like domain (Group 3) n=1 Tax=Bryocella elongata TaxID=863522 RepID=A0A1H5W7H1_9BACT|nr:Ig-like domain-containing protein [Bryocella elongata]SEF95131.1 Ig-like domain (group 3) [Bryocella elongata]